MRLCHSEASCDGVVYFRWRNGCEVYSALQHAVPTHVLTTHGNTCWGMLYNAVALMLEVHSGSA